MTGSDKTVNPKAKTKRKTVTKRKGVAKETANKPKKTAVSKKQEMPSGIRMTEALGETFLVDLITDWHEHGEGVIENCRTSKPDAYLKLIATYAPKEFRKTLEPFEGMSDHDLRTRFREALEEIRALGLDVGS